MYYIPSIEPVRYDISYYLPDIELVWYDFSYYPPAFDKFYELVIHLGLSNISWKNILEQYRGYDQTIVNFVALCKWREQKGKD
jgi:hypothetical protein